MLVWSLGSTHNHIMSSVAYHHNPWTEHTIKLRQVWHAIITLKQHTQSDEVVRGIPLSPLESIHGWTTLMLHVIITLGQQKRSYNVGRDMVARPLRSTHGRMTSGVACHHHPWKAYLIRRCRELHVIIALRQHTRSDNVGCGMPSSPFESIHGHKTLSVACYHRTWKAHMVGKRRA